MVVNATKTRSLKFDLGEPHSTSSILQAPTRHASMADLNAETLSQLPDEMRIFSLISTTARNGPRLGKLSLSAKSTIQTPHYVGNTSRGVIPHLTQDMQRANSTVKTLYMALEDCKYLNKPPMPRLANNR